MRGKGTALGPKLSALIGLFMQGDYFRFPAGHRSACQATNTTARSAGHGAPREGGPSPQSDARSVLLIIRGEIAPRRDADYAAALACLVSVVRSQSNPIELLVLRWSGEASAFTIVCRFENRKARQAFSTSVDYGRWLRALLGLAKPDRLSDASTDGDA